MRGKSGGHGGSNATRGAGYQHAPAREIQVLTLYHATSPQGFVKLAENGLRPFSHDPWQLRLRKEKFVSAMIRHMHQSY
ncbi:MAG: hypothetical protein QF726_09570 [Alphaproteobacteria bacterium]|jgi:hypothetical protein|nr:hypothetical protein [Alphaproteobacteria bacterium]